VYDFPLRPVFKRIQYLLQSAIIIFNKAVNRLRFKNNKQNKQPWEGGVDL
jgi:hypothetical protein